MTPFERRAERALPVGQVLRAAHEQVERLVETAVHRLRRQQLRPRRGQLDRERQSVESPAHAGHGAGVAVVELELRIDRACPGREEAHGVVGHERLEARGRALLREGKRRDRVLVLARQA